jgi:hypothetical protein
LTRAPRSPVLSVLLPTFLAAEAAVPALTVLVSACAMAGMNKTQAAANAANRPNADERNDGDNGTDPSLWQGAYGVSCRARAKRAALRRKKR